MLKTLLIVTALSSFLTGFETKTLKTDFTLTISENVSFAKALDAAGKKVNFVIDDKQLPVRAQMSDGKTNYSLTFRNAQYITTPVSYTITPPDGAFINDIR